MLRNPTLSPTPPQPSIRGRTAPAIPSFATSLAAAPRLADADVLAVACADAGDVPAALLDGGCRARRRHPFPPRRVRPSVQARGLLRARTPVRSVMNLRTDQSLSPSSVSRR